MTNAIGLLLGFIAILIVLLAFFIVLKALFSDKIKKACRNADRTPGRSFVVGLVNFAFFFAVGLAFFALSNVVGFQLFQVVTLIVLIIPAIGIVFGLGSMVELIGERIAPEQRGIRRTTLGTLALSLACALPFVGWFGLLPYVSLLGMGAFIIGLFQRETKPVDLPDAQDDDLDL